MKRYIFFLIVGGICIVGGQFALSLGAHPDRGTAGTDNNTSSNSTVAPLVRGALGLVLGSVLAVSGLLGVAEGYQRQAVRLGKLLNTRLPFDPNRDSDGAADPTVTSASDLERYNQGFWRAYLKSAAALCLFMAGTLALTMAFVDASFLMFAIVLTSGSSIIALLAALIGLPGLQFMRRVHGEVASAADIFAAQPEIPDEEPEPAIRPPRRPWRLPRQRPMDQVGQRLNVNRRPSQITVRHYE